MNKILAAIAQEELKISCLYTRGSDGLDFHEVAVWNVLEALRLAYFAGMSAAREIDKNKSA